MLTDYDKLFEELARKAMSTGASAALLEAHRILCARQDHDAADALLTNWDGIVYRAEAGYEAVIAIEKARSK